MGGRIFRSDLVDVVINFASISLYFLVPIVAADAIRAMHLTSFSCNFHVLRKQLRSGSLTQRKLGTSRLRFRFAPRASVSRVRPYLLRWHFLATFSSWPTFFNLLRQIHQTHLLVWCKYVLVWLLLINWRIEVIFDKIDFCEECSVFACRLVMQNLVIIISRRIPRVISSSDYRRVVAEGVWAHILTSFSQRGRSLRKVCRQNWRVSSTIIMPAFVLDNCAQFLIFGPQLRYLLNNFVKIWIQRIHVVVVLKLLLVVKFVIFPCHFFAWVNILGTPLNASTPIISPRSPIWVTLCGSLMINFDDVVIILESSASHDALWVRNVRVSLQSDRWRVFVWMIIGRLTSLLPNLVAAQITAVTSRYVRGLRLDFLFSHLNSLSLISLIRWLLLETCVHVCTLRLESTSSVINTCSISHHHHLLLIHVERFAR